MIFFLPSCSLVELAYNFLSSPFLNVVLLFVKPDEENKLSSFLLFFCDYFLKFC